MTVMMMMMVTWKLALILLASCSSGLQPAARSPGPSNSCLSSDQVVSSGPPPENSLDTDTGTLIDISL